MITAAEVRETALSLPEAEEHEHWGKASFRVRGKIFAVIQPDGVSLVIKTTKDDKLAFTTLAPDKFQIPDGFGNLAYIVMRMDRIDPAEARELIVQAWKHVSPKKLVKQFSSQEGGTSDES